MGRGRSRIGSDSFTPSAIVPISARHRHHGTGVPTSSGGGFAGGLHLPISAASLRGGILFLFAFLAAAHFGHPLSRIHRAAAFG